MTEVLGDKERRAKKRATVDSFLESSVRPVQSIRKAKSEKTASNYPSNLPSNDPELKSPRKEKAARLDFGLSDKILQLMRGWDMNAINRFRTSNDDEKEPVLVAQNVSQNNFSKILDSDARLPGKFSFENGSVYIIEVPTEQHGRMLTNVVEMVGVFKALNAGNTLITTSAARLNTPFNIQEPDVAIRPNNRNIPPGTPHHLYLGQPIAFYTFIWEFGVTQSVPSLCRLAPIYLGPNTTIQGYGAIKTYSDTAQGTAMFAMLFLRGPNAAVPAQAISFGTIPLARVPAAFQNIRGVGVGIDPPCNASGIPIYQLHIPIARLYADAAIPANLAGVANFDIDLYILQQAYFAR